MCLTNSGFIATSQDNQLDDLEEAKAALEKLSIPISERNEEGGQFLHFSDPDGTALYFIRPKW